MGIPAVDRGTLGRPVRSRRPDLYDFDGYRALAAAVCRPVFEPHVPEHRVTAFVGSAIGQHWLRCLGVTPDAALREWRARRGYR